MSNQRTTTERDTASGHAAIKDSAAFVEFPEKKVLRLTGKDPSGMLNAILTNDVPKKGSFGAYALLLNPKGRVQADLRVIKDGEDILIVTEPEGVEAAREILGRYAPFSRVKMEDAPLSVLGLYGPGAKELLGLELSEHESKEVKLGDSKVLAVGVAVPASGYDLILPEENPDSIRNHLLDLGAKGATTEDYETIRIRAGIPRFGSDITPENFPGEAGVLERAVSFQKGCYPGQETVARMHYRGQPNKNLRRFTLEGNAPEPGTPILQNEKEVGKITSVAPLLVDGKTLVLGYLKRKSEPDGDLIAGGAALSNESVC